MLKIRQKHRKIVSKNNHNITPQKQKFTPENGFKQPTLRRRELRENDKSTNEQNNRMGKKDSISALQMTNQGRLICVTVRCSPLPPLPGHALWLCWRRRGGTNPSATYCLRGHVAGQGSVPKQTIAIIMDYMSVTYICMQRHKRKQDREKNSHQPTKRRTTNIHPQATTTTRPTVNHTRGGNLGKMRSTRSG